ncbi:MAG: 50S ribosomal protein L19 [Candidatus Omnitrophota bacterium]
MQKIREIEKDLIKKELPDFKVGDQVRVLVRLKEAEDKYRLQPFEGLIIAKNGMGIKTSITVRKVSYGEGVERVFPVNSPNVDSIEIVKKGRVKRSKLYYLRKTVSQKASKIEGI